MHVNRLVVELIGERFERLYVLRLVEGVRIAFLCDFVDAARSGNIRKSLFQEEVFGESVGDFKYVAFFAGAFYVLFENNFHGGSPLSLLYRKKSGLSTSWNTF